MKRDTDFSLRLLAACAALFAGSAQAADHGLYFGMEGGANFERRQEVHSDGHAEGDLRFKNGHVGGLVFGMWTDCGLRPEINFDYRRNNLARFRPEGQSGTYSAHGIHEAVSLMGNVWYDPKLPRHPVLDLLHPYVGAGFGGAYLAFHELNINNTSLHRSSDLTYALQLGTGLGVSLSPDVIVSANYRYLQTGIAEYKVDAGPPMEGRYRTMSMMLGLTVLFGVGR
jgi:opacity protein-like surface antigen